MRTHTAPWDYKRIDVIVPALLRLCPECGGYVSPRSPDNRLACLDCNGGAWVNILETHIDEVRKLIAWATLASETQLRMDAARACLLREWDYEVRFGSAEWFASIPELPFE